MGPPLASLRQYSGLSSARLKSSGIWIHLGDDFRTASSQAEGFFWARPALSACLGEELDDLSDFSSSGLVSLTVFQHLWIHRHGVRPARAPLPWWQFSHGCYCVEQFEGSLFTLPLCNSLSSMPTVPSSRDCSVFRVDQHRSYYPLQFDFHSSQVRAGVDGRGRSRWSFLSSSMGPRTTCVSICQ